MGKTILLRHELKGFAPFDLEDAGTADRIAADPVPFLRDHPGRVWFDEAVPFGRCDTFGPSPHPFWVCIRANGSVTFTGR